MKEKQSGEDDRAKRSKIRDWSLPEKLCRPVGTAAGTTTKVNLAMGRRLIGPDSGMVHRKVRNEEDGRRMNSDGEREESLEREFFFLF